MGRVKDFLPYAAKIKASGAQAVITGNWGNDLTLLVKAAREVGFDGKFYTFYGNALGAPAAHRRCRRRQGDRRGRLVAQRAGGAAARPSTSRFRQRFPKPADDYVHMRMQLMVEALAQAIEKAGSAEAGRRGARSWRRPTVQPARPARARCARPTTSSSSRWWWA